MSFIEFEYATLIYADRLREAEHHRLAKKALVGRQYQARNPFQVLANLVRSAVKHTQITPDKRAAKVFGQ